MTETLPAPQIGTANTGYRTKLIEVALPLEAINAASAREKNIRHGHPSTLHLWWSRKPLATARAVLFAQLVDDPSSVPEEFATEEAQDVERQRLFHIIENIVPWESSTNEEYLMAARREIARSVARSVGVPGPETDADVWQILQEHAPPVLDPFCGGGSIPLEAQRLGLNAHASDLNPVAVLVTKSLIEIPPKFAGLPPVNPRDRNQGMGAAWKGVAGLAADVQYYGDWVREEAFKRIGHLYPKAELHGTADATVTAWLWVRTVRCPNPACGIRMPLTSKWDLATKKGRETWVEPFVDDAAMEVQFELRSGPGKPRKGTVDRRGARCISCEAHVPFDHVRAEGRAGQVGQQLMAVVAEGPNGRTYLAPTAAHTRAAENAEPSWTPETELPEQALGFRVQLYGMTRHRDLFTQRQLVALATFSDLVGHAREAVRRDALTKGDSGDDTSLAEGGRGAIAYADAVATYLAFAVDRMADRHSTLARWNPNPFGYSEKIETTFSRQALPMIWDFAEGNPFSDSSGNLSDALSWISKALQRLPAYPTASVELASALSLQASRSIASTDPPYYDNIGYADLSDYFYVWLRRSLQAVFPKLFGTILVPKSEELVATPHRFAGSKKMAEAFFQSGLSTALTKLHDAQDSSFPLTLYYAFKQAESDTTSQQLVSTGWEAMLSALLSAGFQVMGTWPMRTERTGRAVGIGTNALASSIVLVCRPRTGDTASATRREFIAGLRSEMPQSLRMLMHGNIAAVDLAQAAIGPGMRVFSRYAKVLESNGESMTVRVALALINQILYEVQAESDSEYDPDTRWAITWFEQYGMAEGPFGDAETLFKAKDTSESGLEEADIIQARGGKVWLLARTALPDNWDPLKQRRLTVWNVTQHLIHALDTGGETAAADILRNVGGLGEAARDLAYALYLMAERKKWADEAMAYNTLAVAWPEITRLAASMGPAQAGLGLE